MINIPQHNRLIMSHGERVIHYKANICSCSPTGRQEEADITCRKCNGLGVFWSDPLAITAIITGLDSHRQGRQWLQSGIALPEDMTCAPLPGYSRRFRDYDKIIPMWKRGFPYPGELLRRGFKETVLYRPVGNIVRMSKVNPDTGAEILWFEGEDYNMIGDDRKTVEWVSGHGPALDEVYAIVYEPRFEFVSWAAPGPRWEKGRELGMAVLLRKVHLPWPNSNWA